jgi:AcrR family transcriptional regulator
VDQSTDLRRARGDRTRRAVLDSAVQEASVLGLDALSFGALAASAPVNKSAIAGLFGSKEKLQLAAVERATEIYTEHVIAPARSAPRGLSRLWALVLAWTEYSRSRVFRGGCFFRTVEVEFDMRAGAVRDAVVAAQRTWESYVEHQVRIAADAGELAPETDPDQVEFEINALLNAANDRSLLFADDRVYARAEGAVRALLVAHGADPAALR